MPLNGVDGGLHPRIFRRQETDQGDEKRAGIELFGAVALRECAKLGVEAVAADVAVNGIAQRPPALDRTVHLETLDGLDRTVEGHPGHHLGIGEMLLIAAHLPDAVIGLLPDGLKMVEQPFLEVPSLLVAAELAMPAVMQRIHDLTIDVDL